MWMGDYQGQRVAAKVLRVYTTSDLDKIRRVGSFYIILSIFIRELTMAYPEVLQRSIKVEGP